MPNGAALLCSCLFELLKPEREVQLTKGHITAADIARKQRMPDLLTLSNRARGCLEDAQPLPADVSTLFQRDVFSFDMAQVPAAVQLFHRLGVPKKPLTLIEPQFEQPLPPLQLALFPPAVFEPAPPPLERFDLDDEFANEYFKLAQASLTARQHGGREDVSVLEDYVIKAAGVVGIPGAAKMTAQQALLNVFDQVAKWKLHDQQGGGMHDIDTEPGIRI